MLHIKIPKQEYFNDETQEFINIDEKDLWLEHSLLAISKWESKWKKPFIDVNKKDVKTVAEVKDYIRCMNINSDNTDDNIYNYLTADNIKDINNYIDDTMTATTFYEEKASTSKKEIITSELIYFWMISNNIPIECERWHINRLLTLIRIFSIKNAPPKKMSKREIMSRNRALNEARKKQMHTHG